MPDDDDDNNNINDKAARPAAAAKEEEERDTKRPRDGEEENDEGESKKKKPTTSLFGGGVPAFGGGFASLGGGKSSSAFGGFASFSQGAAASAETSFGGVPLKSFEPSVFGGEADQEKAEAPAVDALNGEEGETCLARYRAKLYVLGHFDEGEELSWRERGIGQARVLEKLDSSRLVMRREQTHLLLLNIKLAPKHASVAKHAENAVRLVAVTSATAATTYLLKVKQTEDRDALFDLLQSKTAAAAPVEKEEEKEKDDDRAAAAAAADENV